MKSEISALIVSNNEATVTDLRRHLESLCGMVLTVESCGEALFHLWGELPPHVVFTDTQLPDGTWSDVLAVAKKDARAISVVVISRVVDISLYVETMEKGAYDFMVSPLEATEVEHVFRCAATNALHRRRPAANGRDNSKGDPATQLPKNLEDGAVEDDAEVVPIL